MVSHPPRPALSTALAVALLLCLKAAVVSAGCPFFASERAGGFILKSWH